MRTETWTILRPGSSTEDDRYGDPVPGPPTETPLPGCLFAEASSAEPVAIGRNAVITVATLYAPSGADVRSDDQVRSPAGVVYEVTGKPKPYPGAGVVVSLKEVEG
jgi:hypothetical protein